MKTKDKLLAVAYEALPEIAHDMIGIGGFDEVVSVILYKGAEGNVLAASIDKMAAGFSTVLGKPFQFYTMAVSEGDVGIYFIVKTALTIKF